MVRKGKEPAKKKDKDEEEELEMSALSRAIARIQGAGPSSDGQRLTSTRTPPAATITEMASLPLELQTRLLEEPIKRLFDRYRAARFEHNRSQREHGEALREYNDRHGTEGFAGRLLRLTLIHIS